MTDLNGATIVFDLDGTLVDTAPDLIRATDHALASVGLPPADPVMLRDKISFGARRMIEAGLAQNKTDADEARIERLHHAFLLHYQANIAHSSRPFPGVIEVLHALRADGARLAICTNKSEPMAKSLLNALKMDVMFEAIVGLNTLPVSKPHPGHVLGTIELAGGDHRLAVMVGDSENDVKAAKAAGVPVAAFIHGYTEQPVHTYGPDAVFGAYTELPGLIRALLGRSSSSAS
jgi:phosphoglycolate phosphatase